MVTTAVSKPAAEQSETAVAGTQTSANKNWKGSKPIQVDFGEWTVDEIQICKMGSWGPEGEYVSVGHITLD